MGIDCKEGRTGLCRDGGAPRDFSLRSKWELGSVFAGFGAGFAFGGGGGVYGDARLKA